MRLCEAAFPGIREYGWHHATLTAFASPIAAGKMLDLSVDQMVHAIGISGSRSCTLGAVTAGKLTMMKNTVDPLAAQNGVLAALLAERGFTGPEHVIDGKEGLAHVFGHEWKLNILTDGLGESFRIAQCGMKGFPTEALTHAPLTAVLRIVKTQQVGPDDVESIEVKTIRRAADILSDPSKYDPRFEGDRGSQPAVVHCGGGGARARDPCGVHRRGVGRRGDPRRHQQSEGGRRAGVRGDVPAASGVRGHVRLEERRADHRARRLREG